MGRLHTNGQGCLLPPGEDDTGFPAAGESKSFTPIVVTFNVNGADVDWDAYFAGRVVDAVVYATATNAGGTITLQNDQSGSFADVTDAMTCDTDLDVSRAGTIDDDEVEFSRNDTLRAKVASGAKGIVQVPGIPNS